MSSTTQLSGSRRILPNLMLTAAVAFVAACLVLWLAHLGGVAHATIEHQRSAEMAAESRALCEKWGMAAATPKFAECLADIQAVRIHHWERMVQDVDY